MSTHNICFHGEIRKIWKVFLLKIQKHLVKSYVRWQSTQLLIRSFMTGWGMWGSGEMGGSVVGVLSKSINASYLSMNVCFHYSLEMPCLAGGVLSKSISVFLLLFFCMLSVFIQSALVSCVWRCGASNEYLHYMFSWQNKKSIYMAILLFKLWDKKSIYMDIWYASIHSTCMHIHPSVSPSIRLSVCPSIHPSIHPSCMSQSLPPSLPPSLLSMHASIHPATHPPIQPLFH